MNALERRQRALEFKSSQGVQECEDWSHIEDAHHASTRFDRQHTAEDLSRRHGYMPSKEVPFKYSDNPSYAQLAEQRNPNSLNVNSDYYDIKDHPECRAPMAMQHKSEVAELYSSGNYVKNDEHKRCLLHTMNSQFADVGESVSRGFLMQEGECYGMPTKKQPGDDADGIMNSTYVDKGYTLKNRGEITPEKVTRHITETYNDHIPQNKGAMKPAGVKVERGPGVAQTLCGGYGSDLPNFDPKTKVVRNLEDQSIVHGYISRKDKEKPVCLGGRGAVCEDMLNYRRE